MTLFFLNISLISASEYVKNGDFESYYSLPGGNHLFNNYVTDWTSSTCNGQIYICNNVYTDPYLHSPDYYYNSPLHNEYTVSVNPYTILPSHSGAAFAGLSDYEMIRQELNSPLTGMHQYIFRMYVHSGEVGIEASNWDNSLSRLVIYLSKDEIVYNDNGGNCDSQNLCDCTTDYRTVDGSNSTQAIYSISLSDVTFSNYTNDWVLVEFIFTCPENNAFLGSSQVFNWIGIDLSLNSVPTGPGQCYQSYILVDDVSITDLCDNFCVNGGALSFGYYNNSTFVADSWVNVIGMAPNNVFQAFNTYITNATYVFFEVYSNASQPMFTAEYMDPLGLHNPGYPDFLLLWDGKLNNGNCLTAADVYNARLIIRNCNREFNEIISITLWDPPPGGCHSIPGIYSANAPRNCCPQNATIDNVNYTADARTDVQDYINIAQNGPVSFANNVNVKFHAGNVINVGPNYIANPGANVEMKIVPCGTRMFSNVDSDNNETRNGQGTAENTSLMSSVNNLSSYREEFLKSSMGPAHPIESTTLNQTNDFTFIVKPNPGNGFFTILFKDFYSNSKTISITDAIGNIVSSIDNVKNNFLEIDLSSQPQGIYFVKVTEGEKVMMKKIVKM